MGQGPATPTAAGAPPAPGMARLPPAAAGPLCAPPRPFGLPESLSGAGSQHLYPPPSHEKEPLVTPPAGLQMAPCGCFFDPRMYHIEWAATSFLQPPVYKLSGAAAAPPGAFVLEAQPYVPAATAPAEPFGPYSRLPGGGSAQYAVPYTVPEDGAAPGVLGGEGTRPGAPLLLALPPLALSDPALRGFSHIEGRLKPLATPGLPAAPAPTEFPGCHPVVPTPPQAPSADPGLAGHGAPAELPEQVLLEDAMKLFDCSLAGELDREDAGGGAKHGPRAGTDGFFLREEAARDFGSLWLPEELLSSDYSVPEILSAVLSMDYFYAVKVGPEEPGWDTGLEPPLDTQERWLEAEGDRSLLRAAGPPGELE